MTKAKTSCFENKEDFSQSIVQLGKTAQEGVKQEIATHQTQGRAIYYSRSGKPIMELPDGSCFEYQLDVNKHEAIVSEL